MTDSALAAFTEKLTSAGWRDQAVLVPGAAASALAEGVRPGDPLTRQTALLAPTEARVADLIGAGHTNRSAAAILGVSANTVGTHLRSVFTKLGVRSRVQLANAIRDRPGGRIPAGPGEPARPG